MIGSILDGAATVPCNAGEPRGASPRSSAAVVEHHSTEGPTMHPRSCWLWAALLGVALSACSLQAAALTDSLTKGTPDVKSIGALAFGPEGILFVGDARGAAIFAIDTGDRPASPATGTLKIEGVDEKIA